MTEIVLVANQTSGASGRAVIARGSRGVMADGSGGQFSLEKCGASGLKSNSRMAPFLMHEGASRSGQVMTARDSGLGSLRSSRGGMAGLSLCVDPSLLDAGTDDYLDAARLSTPRESKAEPEHSTLPKVPEPPLEASEAAVQGMSQSAADAGPTQECSASSRPVAPWHSEMLRLAGVPAGSGEAGGMSVGTVAALPEIAHGFRHGCSMELARVADYLDRCAAKLPSVVLEPEAKRVLQVRLVTRAIVLRRWSEKMNDQVIIGEGAHLRSSTRDSIRREVILRISGTGIWTACDQRVFQGNVEGPILRTDVAQCWFDDAVQAFGDKKPAPLSIMKAVETLHCGRVAGCEALESVVDLWASCLGDALGIESSCNYVEVDDLPAVNFSAWHSKTAGIKLNPVIPLLSVVLAPFVVVGPYVEPMLKIQFSRTARMSVSSEGKSVSLTLRTTRGTEVLGGAEFGSGAKLVPIALAAGALAFVSFSVGTEASDGYETTFRFTFAEVRGKTIEKLAQELKEGLKDYVKAINERSGDMTSQPIKNQEFEETAVRIRGKRVDFTTGAGVAAIMTASAANLPGVDMCALAGAVVASGLESVSTERTSVDTGDTRCSRQINLELSTHAAAGFKAFAPPGPAAQSTFNLPTQGGDLSASKCIKLYDSDEDSVAVMQGPREGLSLVAEADNARQGGMAEIGAVPRRKAGTDRFGNWGKFEAWLEKRNVKPTAEQRVAINALKARRPDGKPHVTYEYADGQWNLALSVSNQYSARNIGIVLSYLVVWRNTTAFARSEDSAVTISGPDFVPPFSLAEWVRTQFDRLTAFVAGSWLSLSSRPPVV